MTNTNTPVTRTTYCSGCRQPIPVTAQECPYCGCKPERGLVFHVDGESNIDTKEIELVVKNAAAGIRKVAENDRKREELDREAEQRRAELTEQINAGNSVPFGERKCHSCWFENPPGTIRCIQCGALLRRRDGRYFPEIKYCECGYENEPGTTVCAQCHGYIRNVCPECGHENLPQVTICAKCQCRLAPPKRMI